MSNLNLKTKPVAALPLNSAPPPDAKAAAPLSGEFVRLTTRVRNLEAAVRKFNGVIEAAKIKAGAAGIIHEALELLPIRVAQLKHARDDLAAFQALHPSK